MVFWSGLSHKLGPFYSSIQIAETPCPPRKVNRKNSISMCMITRSKSNHTKTNISKFHLYEDTLQTNQPYPF